MWADIQQCWPKNYNHVIRPLYKSDPTNTAIAETKKYSFFTAIDANTDANTDIVLYSLYINLYVQFFTVILFNLDID